jgi:hypothetical protein
MTAQPARSFTRLSIAIVVASLVIAAAIIVSFSYEPRITLTTTTTSTVTITPTTSTTSTGVTNGSFSFSPASPVRIDSVQALVQQNQGGPDSLIFMVGFTNIGASPITVVGACFSPLEVSPPANSTVVQTATGTFVQCEAISCNSINPAQSSEASTEPAWQGPGPAPHLILVKPGTVTIMFVLHWGTGDNSCTGPNGGPDSTSISATFSFD